MHVREATVNDKEKWNSFVNSEEGSFFHYFDWKYIYEASDLRYIPLILENTASDIVGILPIVRNNNVFYSTLSSLIEGASGGYLFKKDLTDKEKLPMYNLLLDFVNKNYSSDCSTLTLKENLSLRNELSAKPTAFLIEKGFQFKYNYTKQLPCTFILELRQPFEEKIWNGLWTKNLKKLIRKEKRTGVIIKEDKNLDYIDDFTDMLSVTFKRHGSRPLTKDKVMKRVNIFKNNLKMFIALLEERPVAALLCYYTPSTCYLSKMPYRVGVCGPHTTKLLYYEAINDACDNGYKFVEFGTTWTQSLAHWKELFKGTRIPMKIYEKRYSSTRTIIEKAYTFVKYSLIK